VDDLFTGITDPFLLAQFMRRGAWPRLSRYIYSELAALIPRKAAPTEARPVYR